MFLFCLLLIHVFSLFISTSAVLFRFIQYITLSLNLSPPHLYLFLQYYRSIFTRSVCAPIIAHPLFFTTLLSEHLLIVSRFCLPARGSLPNGHPPLQLVVLFYNPLFIFTGPYHRSSYTCSQPATGYMAHLINCTSVQPCPTTICSSFSSVCLPTSPLFQFARRSTALLVLNPTSHQHKHTSI